MKTTKSGAAQSSGNAAGQERYSGYENPADVALGVLRADYLIRVERFVEELCPRILSGELRGWREGDSERFETPPAQALEDLVRARFARTQELARLVIALSPNATRGFSRATDGVTISEPWHWAVEAAVLDVLAEAKTRGWLRAARRNRAA